MHALNLFSNYIEEGFDCIICSNGMNATEYLIWCRNVFVFTVADIQ